MKRRRCFVPLCSVPVCPVRESSLASEFDTSAPQSDGPPSTAARVRANRMDQRLEDARAKRELALAAKNSEDAPGAASSAPPALHDGSSDLQSHGSGGLTDRLTRATLTARSTGKRTEPLPFVRPPDTKSVPDKDCPPPASQVHLFHAERRAQKRSGRDLLAAVPLMPEGPDTGDRSEPVMRQQPKTETPVKADTAGSLLAGFAFGAVLAAALYLAFLPI